MTRNVAFVRKVIYISIIGVLLIPLSFISQPSTPTSSGGKLAQMRTEYGISEAEIGEIDPAGETMKLATLGLRNVAVNILWSQANHYKMVEDWDGLKVVLDQLTRLQPHFISVWTYQGWNLSYNVSVEFDDYRYRYHWVKKGIDFLIRGTRYNRNDARLLWDIGWFFGQKLGRSDEQVQFRRLFRRDDDFHASLPVDVDRARDYQGAVDNWKISQLWYEKAETAVDSLGSSITGKNPLIFYSSSPMAMIKYAETVEDEGYFGEKVQRSWEDAGRAWSQYGDRVFHTSYGLNITLNELEELHRQIANLREQLDAQTADFRDQAIAQARQQLSAEERAALDLPPAKLTPEQRRLVVIAEQKLALSPTQIAAAAPAEKREQLLKLAKDLEDKERRATIVDRYREIVNFAYWRTRCEAEKTIPAVRGRQYLFEAEKLYDQAVLVEYVDNEGKTQPGAKEMYEKAWGQWATVFEAHPALMEDITAEDLVEKVNKYRRLLGQLNETDLPKDFPLRKLLEIHEDNPRVISMPLKETDGAKDSEPADKPATEEKPAGDKPADNEPNSQPNDAKPDADKPETDKPADDKPADSKPADVKPATDGEKPAEQPAAKNDASDPEPAKQAPGDNQPAGDPPAEKPQDSSPGKSPDEDAPAPANEPKKK